MAYPFHGEVVTCVILRPVVFTIGFAFGAIAQAAAQLASPTPQAQIPPVKSSPSASPLESATPVPMPTSTPLETPSSSPLPTPSPVATPIASPPPTPAPTPTPTNPYKYVVDPTPDPSAVPGAPQIIRIEINDRTVHVGGQFACRITTTPNVSNLVLSVEGHNIQIPKAQDGLFAGIQNIPGFIPPWFLKTYQVTFNASTQDGKKAVTTIPITLAY